MRSQMLLADRRAGGGLWPARALDDRPRTGKQPTITPEAKAWLISLACDKAKEHGYPHELWMTRLLARHTRKRGPAAGHECLSCYGRHDLDGAVPTSPRWNLIAARALSLHPSYQLDGSTFPLPPDPIQRASAPTVPSGLFSSPFASVTRPTGAAGALSHSTARAGVVTLTVAERSGIP
jgi:hypothetical protein